jgi:hypothetical protein
LEHRPDAAGKEYDASALNVRYRLRIKAVGGTMLGKFWNAADPAPASDIQATIPWTTGIGVRFYTYGANGAVLESLTVTVP